MDLPSPQWLYRNSANVVGCCGEASIVLPIRQQTGNHLWDSFKASLRGAHLSYYNSQKGCHCWHYLGHLSKLSQLPLLYQREKEASQEAHALERNRLELAIKDVLGAPAAPLQPPGVCARTTYWVSLPTGHSGFSTWLLRAAAWWNKVSSI